MRLKYFIQLARIDHGLMVLVAILSSLSVCKGTVILGDKSLVIGILGGFAGLFTEIALFVFNDYYNIEEDKINAPHRPLVKGVISLKEALLFGTFAAFIALILSTYIYLSYNLYNQLILIITTLILGLLYDYSLKKVILINNLIVSGLTALPFIYGMFLNSNTKFKI